MKNIELRLKELFAYVQYAEKVNPSVSSSNVGWHIEHSLLVIIKMITAVIA